MSVTKNVFNIHFHCFSRLSNQAWYENTNHHLFLILHSLIFCKNPDWESKCFRVLQRRFAEVNPIDPDIFFSNILSACYISHTKFETYVNNEVNLQLLSRICSIFNNISTTEANNLAF